MVFLSCKVYKRFVQVGRVILINAGPDSGKLATIVDVLDQNRVFMRFETY